MYGVCSRKVSEISRMTTASEAQALSGTGVRAGVGQTAMGFDDLAVGG